MKANNSKQITVNKKKITIIDQLKPKQTFTVRDGEEKTFFILLVDGKDQSGDVTIKIRGSNAKANIVGCIVGYQDQKIEINSVQDHQKKESTSDLLIKSVLFDRSMLYYKGLINIAKDAQKSNA